MLNLILSLSLSPAEYGCRLATRRFRVKAEAPGARTSGKAIYLFNSNLFHFTFPFLERRSRKIPFQSVGGELRKRKRKSLYPSLYSFSDI